MGGMNRYEEKHRRKIRRRNHIYKDLATPKYRQSKIPNKKKDHLKNEGYDKT